MATSPDSGSVQFDAVLLLAYGGPTTPEQVLPFLKNLMGSRPGSEARLQQIASRYRLIGGYSPLVHWTERQAQALRQRLAQLGIETTVQIGMRTGSPSIGTALEQLVVARGARTVVAIVMTPFESEASHGRYRADVCAACEALGRDAPQIVYAPSFYAHDGFIRAHADRVESILEGLGPHLRERAALIFTAHSVPVVGADHLAYAEQIAYSAQRIATAVGKSHYQIGYQSRSGPPEQPWLGPSLLELIQQEARREKPLVVVPVGFVCDNLEVLYDLDIEAVSKAASVGASLYRCPTIGDHPAFVDALVALCS